jgi:CubicO group peptidase (beta-lactamase class C family)
MNSTKLRLILFFMAISATAIAQNQKLEREIDSIMKQRSVVGLSVAVVKNGEITYAHAFGLKELEHQTPLDNSSIFRIASISKSFSATAIMQLVAEKKVSLDDDFSKLVGFSVRNPKFPSEVITLKMVLSHTSSINDSEGYFNWM